MTSDRLSSRVSTIVLAYSGGLDTSVIVPWLKEHYPGANVVCVAADIGQGDELGGVRAKALASGADECFVEDLQDASSSKSTSGPPSAPAPSTDGNTCSAPRWPGRSSRRRQVEVARRIGADALAHGCTGKGNDQVRFELTYAAFAPDLAVIAPWREWDIRSREDAIAYAAAHNFPVDGDRREDLFARPEPLAPLARGRRSRGSQLGADRRCVPAHRLAGARARQAGDRHDRLRAGHAGLGERRGPGRGHVVSDAQHDRRPPRRRTRRSGRGSARRHEVARHLRDAGRHAALHGAQ